MWYAMTMKQTKKQEIVHLLSRREYSPADLQREMGVSLVTIHRNLRELCRDGYVGKWGKPPRVVYRLVPEESVERIPSDIIDEQFVFKDPVGNILTGSKGFLRWSQRSLKQKTLYEKVVDYEAYVQKMKEQKVHTFSLEKEKQLSEEVGEPLHIKEKKYRRVLLVDDFVGSGATLNQIAKKIINQGVGEEVCGMTIIGVTEKKFPVVRTI